jgi:hypothetical protein
MAFFQGGQSSKVIGGLFAGATRVMVNDGQFIDVQGEYHSDYSNAYDMASHTIPRIHNVSNTCPQLICMFPTLSSDFRIVH